MRIWRLVVGLVLVALPLMGCNGDGGTGSGEGSVVGTYTLRQVNGVAVPGQPFGTQSARFIAGSVTLNPDGTHRQSLTEQPSPNHDVRTYSYTGGYTVSPTGVAMNINEGDDESYTIRELRREGGALVGEPYKGVTFTYRK